MLKLSLHRYLTTDTYKNRTYILINNKPGEGICRFCGEETKRHGFTSLE